MDLRVVLSEHDFALPKMATRANQRRVVLLATDAKQRILLRPASPLAGNGLSEVVSTSLHFSEE